MATINNALIRVINDAAWEAVPAELIRLVKLAAAPARIVANITSDLPEDDDDVAVWYQPDDRAAWVCSPSEEKLAFWCDTLAQVPFIDDAAGSVSLNQSPDVTLSPWFLLKRAGSAERIFGPIAQLAGHKPGLWPGAPSTLTATLGSSLLGAGAGYGLGFLAEQLLPAQLFEKGKLRRTGAVLGGIAAGAPSLWYGLRGGYKQDPPGTIPPSQTEPDDPDTEQANSDIPRVSKPGYGYITDPTKDEPGRTVIASASNAANDGNDIRCARISLYENLSPIERQLDPLFGRYISRYFHKDAAEHQAMLWLEHLDKFFVKKADDEDDGGGLAFQPNAGFQQQPNVGGAMYLPAIQTDQFNKVVWNDPFTPASVRAATTGIVEAASLARGGTSYITPMDIARIGIGAGSGYVAASFVGRTLGALAGLRPETQKTLQQIGTWAGVLTNVVPLAFGGR